MPFTSLQKVATIFTEPLLRRVAEAVNAIIDRLGRTPEYFRTEAEIAASVTPVDYRYAPGEPRRLGAPDDGETDAQAELNSLASAAYKVVRGTDAGTYSVSASITWATGQTVKDLDIVGDPNLSGAMSLDGNASEIILHSLNVETTADTGGGGHAYATHEVPFTDLIVGDSFLNGARYGFLESETSNATIVDGVLLHDSIITSGLGDAVTFDHRSGSAEHYVASGLILNVLTGSPPNGGFAYSVAGIQHHVLSGAVIRGSKQEAIHIEDVQKGGVIAAVSGHNIDGDGVKILKSGASGDTADANRNGVVVVGVHLTHDEVEANTGHSGGNHVSDSAGSLRGCTFVANYFKGFETGLSIGGVTTATNDADLMLVNVDGTVVDGCDIALKTQQLAFVTGDILAVDTPVLASMVARSRAGRIYSDTEPTTIMAKVGTAFPGPYIRGFGFSKSVAHTGSGAETLDLFALPSRLQGKLIIRWESTPNGVFYAADIHWDGTTLTPDNEIDYEPGTSSVGSVSANSGQLAISITSLVAITAPMTIEFDGVFFQA